MKKRTAKKKEIKKIEQGIKSLKEMLEKIVPFEEDKKSKDFIHEGSYGNYLSISKAPKGGW